MVSFGFVCFGLVCFCLVYLFVYKNDGKNIGGEKRVGEKIPIRLNFVTRITILLKMLRAFTVRIDKLLSLRTISNSDHKTVVRGHKTVNLLIFLHLEYIIGIINSEGWFSVPWGQLFVMWTLSARKEVVS